MCGDLPDTVSPSPPLYPGRWPPQVGTELTLRVSTPHSHSQARKERPKDLEGGMAVEWRA